MPTDTTPPVSAPPPPRGRSALYWPIRFLAVVIVGLVVWRWFATPEPPEADAGTPVNAMPKPSVPPFMLTERSGRSVTNNDLAGKIWVADFVFTTCPGPCPLITANMAKLQKALEHDQGVQLVSFTVDPQDDTPAVLSAYADRFGADPNRWWFLTGPEKPLYDLIQNGFLQSVQDNHGQGRIRGFFGGVTADDQTNLLRAIRQLEKESGS